MNSKINELSPDFLQLARIALTGRQQDIQLLLHRTSKKFRNSYPELTDALIALLQESPSKAIPLRKQSESPLPVDLDSRLQLLRIEKSQLEHEPILASKVLEPLKQALSERKNTASLLKHGLLPTKSMLFTGPPGVGKTMAAKWVAEKMEKPLLVLDLAAVMSSFLGRTGNNIRYVLDYAKNTECVLLLDELDAIAKRRDDSSEIGELKRLVTVLLQEIDDWPASGLLIAATNHPNLLDPAIWRRFEIVLEFQNPTEPQIEEFIYALLKEEVKSPQIWCKILSKSFLGKSYSDIERLIILARKSAAINDVPLENKIKDLLIVSDNLSHEERIKLACILVNEKIISQRQAQELTGIARNTIRKKTNKL
ncbi:ATP-binding protein [Bacteroides ihuae]|uniref:ATP-binding protein n=1 Tax=Bacteroides ihuae TaxID=1852362 RepID=UPI0008D99A2E|nr:ATP-binding protein [Bacteroides ihuae]